MIEFKKAQISFRVTIPFLALVINLGLLNNTSIKNLMNNFNLESWHGHLDLVYQYHQQQTKIVSAYSVAPFKIQSPFYPQGKEKCHSLILHTAGGIVGGDYLSQNIHLQPQAQVLISNPAATKIYGSKSKTAQQNIKINLEKNSHLEYLPQETIVYNQGQFKQTLKIELGLQATWIGWEIIRFGRTARGEIFSQGEWKSSTEVWQNQIPLWIDKQWFPGNEKLFSSQNGLAGKPVCASLSLLGKAIAQDLITQIRDLGRKGNYNGQLGVSQLLKGLLCRYRGNSVAEAKNWFTDTVQLLRQLS